MSRLKISLTDSRENLRLQEHLPQTQNCFCSMNRLPGMNPNETEELMDMIKFVRDHFHMTILLIEHDMKLVSGICEQLTVLNFGEVLAQGDTSDVLNNPQVIKAYLGE